MPTEFAFQQIADYVYRYEPAQIDNAELYIRDGLPALKVYEKSGFSHLKVFGFVLYPNVTADLVSVVQAYEGSNYRRVGGYVSDAKNNKIECEYFVGVKIEQSHPEPWEGEWSTAFSPLIGYGLPNLISSMKLNSRNIPNALNPGNYWTETLYWQGKNGWPGILRLEGNYLTLCSIFEYLLTLRFGRIFGNDVEKKIKAISRDQHMLEAFDLVYSSKKWDVRDVTNIGAGKATPSNLAKALDAIYTTRSNLTHRGKSGMNDASVIINASQLLGELLTQYILIVMPKVREIWPHKLTSGRIQNF